ncbi:MAG: ADP-ribosylglycohydrolase family protein [Methanobacterium sp.]
MNKQIIDRARGSIIGLAVGDALGVPLEFKSPGTFEPVEDMIGGGSFNLKPGEWTDDTSMALCLAESLIEKQGFDPADQLERYTLWYREGYLSVNGKCFDIGNTTREALHKFEETHGPYCGPTYERSAGNGSIMRLAPVPIFYFSSPEDAVSNAGKSSRTTHGHILTVDACRYMAGLIVGAMMGHKKEQILSCRYCPVSGFWDTHELAPEIDEIARGSFKHKNPPEVVGSGYVVKSLEAALWAFYNSDNFEEGALTAVNLGDDADTTGAVYGQIAGAYYGESGIPESWKNKLTCCDLIQSFADRLIGNINANYNKI